MLFKFPVFILLALLLFFVTGASIYMGIFKSHGPEIGWGRKLITGLFSYTISGVYWFFSYGYHYLDF